MLDVAQAYADHGGILRAYAIRLVANWPEIDADDICSMTWERAIRRAALYQGDRYASCGALPWLKAIALNVVRDYWRAHRKGLASRFLDTADAEDAVAPPTADPFEAVERAVFVQQMLQPLTDKQRTVIQFRYLDGMSIAETAAATSMGEEGLKQLAARALRQMRKRARERNDAEA